MAEEALQIAEERREVKSLRRKGKVYPTECRVPENSMVRYEGLLQLIMQRSKRKTIQEQRLEVSSRKLEISREYVTQRLAP